MKYWLFLSLFLIGSCASNEEEEITVPEDLSSHLSGEGILLQGFYWDVEPRHGWWRHLEEKLEEWQDLGVNRLWLPPASKGMSGGYSMGYDPMDYFDLGEFNQMGTLPTRFGTRAELNSLIQAAHERKIEVIADIVLNHNSGGQLEYNPFRNKDTYTLFTPASGRFPRKAEHFHPNAIHDKDAEALFFEEQDLCHEHPEVKKWFWESDSSVAKYYKNTVGFDGWRFDYVKGFAPEVVKSWMQAVGGFGVLEVWDGNTDYLRSWVEKTGIKAFDFANFYTMEQAFDGNNLQLLMERRALWKELPDQAVTFVNNHDTEKDTQQGNRIGSATNRMLAYAYIFTHPGYPCLFYSDYEKLLDKKKIARLIQINRALAKGHVNVLFADANHYLAQRTGDDTSPGLLLHLNNSAQNVKRSVTTPWKNAVIYDYSENSTLTLRTDAQGRVDISTPAQSYSVWSLKKF
jgi:alpha-amylase